MCGEEGKVEMKARTKVAFDVLFLIFFMVKIFRFVSSMTTFVSGVETVGHSDPWVECTNERALIN